MAHKDILCEMTAILPCCECILVEENRCPYQGNLYAYERALRRESCPANPRDTRLYSASEKFVNPLKKSKRATSKITIS